MTYPSPVALALTSVYTLGALIYSINLPVMHMVELPDFGFSLDVSESNMLIWVFSEYANEASQI